MLAKDQKLTIVIQQTIQKHNQFNDHYSVEFHANGPTLESVRELMEKMFELLAPGKLKSIRCPIEVEKHPYEEGYRGYLRYTLINQPGEVCMSDWRVEKFVEAPH